MESNKPKTDNNNERDTALTVLMDMEAGAMMDHALENALRRIQFSDKKSRSLVSRLVRGVTERRITLDFLIDSYSRTPVVKMKPLIRSSLRLGIYQLLYMEKIPASAAVNETVKLVRKHGFGSLSGFVNGVLRSIERGKDGIQWPDKTDRIKHLSVMYSTPEWLVKLICAQYPDKAERILAANLDERKLSIRVNRTMLNRQALISELEEDGVRAEPSPYSENALIISDIDFLMRLFSFREGRFTVQDISSQCAVEALDIKPDDIVWDICAAPGGKTTAAAERVKPGKGHIYSMDISEDKLSLIEENAERLNVEDKVTVLCHDATKPYDTDMKKPDVIIADLPCSGLGVMARKSDIRYRVTPESTDELIKLQHTILDNTVKELKKGGKLMFSTCTINQDENEAGRDYILENHPGLTLISERLFLQGVDPCDGFYYAIFIKNE